MAAEVVVFTGCGGEYRGEKGRRGGGALLLLVLLLWRSLAGFIPRQEARRQHFVCCCWWLARERSRQSGCAVCREESCDDEWRITCAMSNYKGYWYFKFQTRNEVKDRIMLVWKFRAVLRRIGVLRVCSFYLYNLNTKVAGEPITHHHSCQQHLPHSPPYPQDYDHHHSHTRNHHKPPCLRKSAPSTMSLEQGISDSNWCTR